MVVCQRVLCSVASREQPEYPFTSPDKRPDEFVHYTTTHGAAHMNRRISQSGQFLSLFAAGLTNLAGLGCSRDAEVPPALETTSSAGNAAPAVSVAYDTGSRLVASTTAGPATPRRARTSVPAQDKWLSYDAATNTVTFELIAGPFTFNGFRNGEGTLVVPSKANIVMNFVNKDGTPHSAILISGEGPIPNSASDPAIPRAYTSKVLEGMPQEASDVMRFPVPESGTYRIFCGVPGHGLSGMWIWMKVDPGVKTPSFGATT